MSEFGEQLEYFVGFLIVFVVSVIIRFSLNKEFYGHHLPFLDLFKRLFYANTRKKALKQVLFILSFYLLFLGGLLGILLLDRLIRG